jgi:starch phosphorylase
VAIQIKMDSFVSRISIAYFSMEIALSDEMHTYAGGLGVLAGDMARSAADLDIPIVFVSLLSRQGYVNQSFAEDGTQVSGLAPWEPERWAAPLKAMVAVEIDQREVWIRPWLHIVQGLGGSVPVLLLDTDLDQNSPADRGITSRLYPEDARLRFKQEIVLGIGGEQLLRALGFEIQKYHLNEGHAALLPVTLLKRTYRDTLPVVERRLSGQAEVQSRCVFTTHTPVDAAFDRFDYALVENTLGAFVEVEDLKVFGGADLLNMTRLALNLSGYVNGVAERHAVTAQRLFPGTPIRSITNGVHVQTWTHHRFASVYDSSFPHWRHEPELLGLADQIPDLNLWEAHQAAKDELIAHIRTVTGRSFARDAPIIGYARRMTSYKRPDLLFNDLGRLKAIASKRAFQIVLAGIAHPADTLGQKLVAALNRHCVELGDNVPTVFLPGHGMKLAKMLVSGSDVWLNTPLPPLEASGTSGMKAALNGVLNLSVKDGWWIEGCVEGVTGWGLDGESEEAGSELLDRLENVVLPLYYDDRTRWTLMMKNSIGKLGPLFNSQRMVRRYVSEAYLSGHRAPL